MTSYEQRRSRKHPSSRRITALLLLSALSVSAWALSPDSVASSPPAPTRLWLKTERFERDPGWDAARNRVAMQAKVKRQDFGYQPGEAGQKFGRPFAALMKASSAPEHRLP